MDSPLINIMQKAAKKASRGLRRDFNELENLQVKTKGPANFVTASDIRTQKIIYDELSYAKPLVLFRDTSPPLLYRLAGMCGLRKRRRHIRRIVPSCVLDLPLPLYSPEYAPMSPRRVLWWLRHC